MSLMIRNLIDKSQITSPVIRMITKTTKRVSIVLISCFDLCQAVTAQPAALLCTQEQLRKAGGVARTVGAALRGRPCVELFRSGLISHCGKARKGREVATLCFRAGAATEGRPYSMLRKDQASYECFMQLHELELPHPDRRLGSLILLESSSPLMP
jgi:hypothetical protein